MITVRNLALTTIPTSLRFFWCYSSCTLVPGPLTLKPHRGMGDEVGGLSGGQARWLHAAMASSGHLPGVYEGRNQELGTDTQYGGLAVRFARVVLALSAVPFFCVGIAFTLCPVAMSDLVGVSLADATAIADVRAVYGGLQLGCALFLGLAAAFAEWSRAGLAAQLALYGGLAGARFLSYLATGLPSLLGLALHGGELVGFALGVFAWRKCFSSAREAAA